MNKNIFITVIAFVLLGAISFHACGRKGPEDPPDTTPPLVSATSPSYNEQNVPVDVSITVTFNEEMDASTINNQTISLTDSTGTNVMNGTVTCSGTTATFTPNENLTMNGEYRLTISAGIKDVAGNAMVGPYACPFTTGTTTSDDYTITATAGANGSISPSGPVQVAAGAAQSFTIAPASGYHVADVVVDGHSVGAVTTYAFSNVTADHAIAASFAGNPATTYTITATADANGSISPSGPVQVAAGAAQSFTIAPASGHHVADVVVDGHSVGAVTTYAFSNVTADHAIAASFAGNPATTYTITATAGANGSISPSGPVQVAAGAAQSFTIAPASGYHVADVVVDGHSVGAVTTYAFSNVTADHAIAASFAGDPVTTFIITASVTGGNGTIQPSGTVIVNQGADKSFTIEPDPGYSISAVLVDGVFAGVITSYKFENVTADHTISASFAQTIYTISTVVEGYGSIEPESLQVSYNERASFLITAAYGYRIEDVKGCHGRLEGDSLFGFTYRTGPITANCTVTARFRAI